VLFAAYALARWRPARVQVRGPSMAPTLLSGDLALALAPGRPRRGEVVVVEHPDRPGFEVVKRVVAGPGELAPDGSTLPPDRVWIEGDAPSSSTDSRAFGAVGIDRVRARVRLVYWPPARWRLL